MATILLGFPLQYTFAIKLFLSHIALTAKKRKFLILSLDIFQGYSITIKSYLSLFATEINSISYYENMIK